MSLNNLICTLFNKEEVSVGEILLAGVLVFLALGSIATMVNGASHLISVIIAWIGLIFILLVFYYVYGKIYDIKITKCERKQEEEK